MMLAVCLKMTRLCADWAHPAASLASVPMIPRTSGAAAPFVAHRGGRVYGPDASRRALSHAIAGGVAGIEIDVVRTADDQLVLLHDSYLPRATTLDGWSFERSAEEILGARLLGGDGRASEERPLHVDELVDLVRPWRGTTQFEVKAWASPEDALRTTDLLLERLTAADAPPRDEVEVISFWPGACARAAAAGFDTRLIVACAYTPEELARWANRCGVTGVILEPPYFSAAVVAAWRAAGLSIMCGCINDPVLLRTLLVHEPDAVSSDRPLELAAEIAAGA
jgi:glycerophosphoryl diester phosphodiesterase